MGITRLCLSHLREKVAIDGHQKLMRSRFLFPDASGIRVAYRIFEGYVSAGGKYAAS
jgi:hypothetical protein